MRVINVKREEHILRVEETSRDALAPSADIVIAIATICDEKTCPKWESINREVGQPIAMTVCRRKWMISLSSHIPWLRRQRLEWERLRPSAREMTRERSSVPSSRGGGARNTYIRSETLRASNLHALLFLPNT